MFSAHPGNHLRCDRGIEVAIPAGHYTDGLAQAVGLGILGDIAMRSAAHRLRTCASCDRAEYTRTRVSRFSSMIFVDEGLGAALLQFHVQQQEVGFHAVQTLAGGGAAVRAASWSY
jgi:hypothetical protein